MIRSHRSANRPRRGFSLLEIQAAFIVLGFSMAALVPFAVAQLKLIAALEGKLPPNATYVIMSRNHGLVNLLADGGGTTLSLNRPPGSPNYPNNIIKIDQVQPGSSGGPMDWTATVTASKTPSSGGN